MLKKLIIAAVLMLGMLNLTGCMQTIEPGHTGIKISRVGDNRGVSKENLVSGWVFYFPLTTKIVEYPVFNQRVVWTADKNEGHPNDESITFQTKDNVPVNVDIAISYTLQDAKVPEFYNKYRNDKIESFTHGFMRDQTRNVMTKIGSEYSFDDVNGVKKEEFIQRVSTTLQSVLAVDGVQINGGLSIIGAFRIPGNLKDAINARVQSIQDAIKAENDLRKMKAEAAKAVAVAEGEAAANRAKAASLTPALMEWKRLEIEQDRVAKWNGKLPDTMLGSGSNTLFNLK